VHGWNTKELEDNSRPPSFHHSILLWLKRNTDKLWWAHSAYALLLGLGIMWLGARDFTYLRVAVFHVALIWLISLFLPKLLDHPRVTPRWAPRIRFLANFFSKNLYQQVLFFVLPIYYGSATLSSGNFLFVILVALSATLSTLDIVYDRILSTRRSLTALFFTFNLFVLINVMLPVLWSVSNTWTTRLSALAAAAGLLSFYSAKVPARQLKATFAMVAAAAVLVLVELGRGFIPPAPLRLTNVAFGTEFQTDAIQVISPLTTVAPGNAIRLYGLTAIKAPLGLKDRVRHRWFVNDRLIWQSPFYMIVGGREAGFRYWTRCYFATIPGGADLRLDVETEGGQLIGRAHIPAANA
jgi:preprotein translocase subunit Sec61beta